MAAGIDQLEFGLAHMLHAKPYGLLCSNNQHRLAALLSASHGLPGDVAGSLPPLKGSHTASETERPMTEKDPPTKQLNCFPDDVLTL